MLRRLRDRTLTSLCVFDPEALFGGDPTAVQRAVVKREARTAKSAGARFDAAEIRLLSPPTSDDTGGVTVDRAPCVIRSGPYGKS